MMEQIYHYVEIDERIGSAGQPKADQFAAIAQAGVEVVINLLPSDSKAALPDEKEVVHRLGMAYVHIPVVWTAPTLADLDEFFAVMHLYRDKKVLVHCAVNARVSCFLYLYRVLRQGVPAEVAERGISLIWEPNATWSQFIEEALARRDVES